MERLTDIVNADLRNILCDFRDFTRPVRLKVGNVVYSIYASLQSDKIALTADIEPINVYELSIYFEDITDELSSVHSSRAGSFSSRSRLKGMIHGLAIAL